MEILSSQSHPRAPHSTVLSIGVYDGVHAGHRRTIAHAADVAERKDLDLIVVTFEPHPAEILRPDRAPKMLTDLTQRLEIFDSLGVDAVYVIAFDAETAAQTPESFIEDLLVRHLGCAEVIVGDDFRFGAQRAGDVALLRREGQRFGYEVSGVTLGEAEGGVISSTRIRAEVSAGRVGEAAQLLTRCHELRGVVVHGDGRGGSELGYPTANLELSPRLCLPGDGVYAGWYRDDVLGTWPAAISVGRRPTFLEGADPLVEAHLLDFEGDLYTREARVSFGAWLRGEERFDSVEALIEQMDEDCAVARAFCEEHKHAAPRFDRA